MDYNQIAVANYCMAVKMDKTKQDFDFENYSEEDIVRHMVLNSIRSAKMRFQHEYGQVVLATDHKNTWRKEKFPYYKANRKKSRDDSTINWTKLLEALNIIRDEIRNVFPYPVIHVDGAEGDDIIGVLARTFGETEKVLIYGRDKDFVQLQSDNVRQYDSIGQKFMDHENPDEFLLTLILKGDKDDGVPNFLMADDTLVQNIRQRPITQKIIDRAMYTNVRDFCENEDQIKNFQRNAEMIDLMFTPSDLQDKILEEYENQKNKQKGDLFQFFLDKKLNKLLTSIGEF